MPTKNTQVSALVRLEELREGGRQARRHADELAAAARGAGRRRDAAANALRSYFAGVESGDQADPQREEELRTALADIERRTVARSALTQGRQVTTYHDPESEGRADAARDRADQAAALVDAFVSDHRDELQAELIERSVAARARLLAALGELGAADGEWRSARNAWVALGLAEIGELPPPLNIDDVTLVYEQVKGGAKDARGIFPCPPRHAPGGENEERHTPPLRGWEHVPRVISSMHGLGT